MGGSNNSQPIGVIGLGLLGTALAERLLGAGYRVLVYNRTRDKAAPLIALGATWSDNPLRDCDVCVVCLYTTEVVEEVLGELGAAWRPKAVCIDCTTGEPTATLALAEQLQRRGVRYLETPIAASSDQTRRGEALALVAGDQATFAEVEPVLRALAPRSMYVGPWGSAAKMKLVSNLVLGLNRLALAEGLVFAEKIGLRRDVALQVFQTGNANSGVMETKGAKMLTGDFTPQAKLSQHAKDVRLMLAEAQAFGTALPVTTLHLQLLEAAERMDLGELDNSAILRAVEAAARGEVSSR